MKSFCIKVDSEVQKNFLIEQLEQIELNDFYISSWKFKIYDNIIVHYIGNDIILFQKNLSHAIANTITQFYDENILEKIIHKNYFYLSEDEQDSIMRISMRILTVSKENNDFGK
ncbi:MAG: putative sporulation protein YtxC, partial [Clostridia bacterium]